jgi:hypothetical protein
MKSQKDYSRNIITCGKILSLHHEITFLCQKMFSHMDHIFASYENTWGITMRPVTVETNHASNLPAGFQQAQSKLSANSVIF